MRKYFYSDGKNKFGPFSIEELREKNITKDTLIWFQGLSDWRPIINFPELYEVYMPSTPPPITSSTSSFNYIDNTTRQPPKTWLVESILATLFCCLPLGVVGIVNASKVESRFDAGDFEGANKASADAGTWTKWSFGIGIVGGIIYFIVMLIVGFDSY